ncbi:flavodoxin family protein [bacterium]|nr:flavodoxin family protein [candidate division CSSED10-310 bacterium]
MKCVCIYGNPKTGGFVHDCLDFITDRLESQHVDMQRIRLNEARISDCTGCFTCLRTGRCVIDDDMTAIIAAMREADGYITGASVRNGMVPALFKRFYERVTYTMGFTRELRGKYVLAIGAVGVAGGRSTLGKILPFKEYDTFVSDFLFFKTGIPTRLTVDAVLPRLQRAVNRFYTVLEQQPPLPFRVRINARISDAIFRTFLFGKNPDGVYDYVIDHWKKKGLMPSSGQSDPPDHSPC